MSDKCDDAEVIRVWRDSGLPEYVLGNGGTNWRLVQFAKNLREGWVEKSQGDGGAGYIVVEEFPKTEVWEFAAWYGDKQLVLGHRPTRDEAYAAATEYLDKEMQICAK